MYTYIAFGFYLNDGRINGMSDAFEGSPSSDRTLCLEFPYQE